jgi:hypothetical protein
MYRQKKNGHNPPPDPHMCAVGVVLVKCFLSVERKHVGTHVSFQLLNHSLNFTKSGMYDMLLDR